MAKTDKQLAATRAWKARNKEHVSAYNREYSRQNRDRRRAIDRRYKDRHRDELAAKQRDYIARQDPAELATTKRAEYERNKATYRAYNKRQYAADPEGEKAKVRAWREANPGWLEDYRPRHAELRRAARRRDPTKTRLENHRRRHEAPLDPDYARLLLGDPCSYCGGPCEQIDHIVPVAAGGEGGAGNMTAACRSCNSAKRDKPLLTFLSSRSGCGLHV